MGSISIDYLFLTEKEDFERYEERKNFLKAIDFYNDKIRSYKESYKDIVSELECIFGYFLVEYTESWDRLEQFLNISINKFIWGFYELDDGSDMQDIDEFIDSISDLGVSSNLFQLFVASKGVDLTLIIKLMVNAYAKCEELLEEDELYVRQINSIESFEYKLYRKLLNIFTWNYKKPDPIINLSKNDKYNDRLNLVKKLQKEKKEIQESIAKISEHSIEIAEYIENEVFAEILQDETYDEVYDSVILDYDLENENGEFQSYDEMLDKLNFKKEKRRLEKQNEKIEKQIKQGEMIIKLKDNGFSNKSIADKMECSPNTVKHRLNKYLEIIKSDNEKLK